MWLFFVFLQASEYIFKYIIQSRRLFSLATGGQNEEEFRMCIHELFMSIRFFLSQENKGISPVAQTQVCVHESVLFIRCSDTCEISRASSKAHVSPGTFAQINVFLTEAPANSVLMWEGNTACNWMSCCFKVWSWSRKFSGTYPFFIMGGLHSMASLTFNQYWGELAKNAKDDPKYFPRADMLVLENTFWFFYPDKSLFATTC